ncbi:MAG: hypothetical protein IT323_17955, partial [Anaerolineae bacterium]|nr:hypothetical protein [Anaerolineae bacterium]
MQALKGGLFALTVVFLVAGFAASAHAQPGEPVAAEFQALYDTLSAQLDDAEAFVGAQPVTADAAPVFAAELLPANGNRGEALLRRSTLP